MYSWTVSDCVTVFPELSSDSGQQQSSFRDVEAELREMRLSFVMEIEKRKQAEEAFSNMQKQWQNVRRQLSLAGLTLPADPTELEGDDGDTLCRQVHLARFVANAIGRGSVRAELEAEMEKQVEAKNFEIARLCDKLRNYEAMNQEMVQRNQDVLGNAFVSCTVFVLFRISLRLKVPTFIFSLFVIYRNGSA